jgi:hypothetical protein
MAVVAERGADDESGLGVVDGGGAERRVSLRAE